VPGLTYARLADVGSTATPAQLQGVDAVINMALKFGPESFTGRDRLTVIARWGVGYEMIDVDACTANDVALCITPEGVRRPMAEAEMAMLLALSSVLPRRIARCAEESGGARGLDWVCASTTGSWERSVSGTSAASSCGWCGPLARGGSSPATRTRQPGPRGSRRGTREPRGGDARVRLRCC